MSTFYKRLICKWYPCQQHVHRVESIYSRVWLWPKCSKMWPLFAPQEATWWHSILIIIIIVPFIITSTPNMSLFISDHQTIIRVNSIDIIISLNTITIELILISDLMMATILITMNAVSFYVKSYYCFIINYKVFAFFVA